MNRIKVCPESGLKIEDQADALESIGILEQSNKEYKAIIKAIKEDYSLNDNVKIKRREYFYKLYKDKYKIFLDISPTTCKLFLFLLYNMDHNDNVVIIDNKHPTHKDIITQSGISDKSIIKGLNELKKWDVIHVNNKGRYREIIISPYMIEDTMTGLNIYKLFKK